MVVSVDLQQVLLFFPLFSEDLLKWRLVTFSLSPVLLYLTILRVSEGALTVTTAYNNTPLQSGGSDTSAGLLLLILNKKSGILT